MFVLFTCPTSDSTRSWPSEGPEWLTWHQRAGSRLGPRPWLAGDDAHVRLRGVVGAVREIFRARACIAE